MKTPKTTPIYQAKARLSELIDRALRGEQVVISRGTTPVVQLVPVYSKIERRFGALQGRAVVGKEFFEPLSDEELKAWE